MTKTIRVHGIGTLLSIEGTMHMVAGYRMVEQDGMTGLAYFMVPYPLGLVGVQDVSLVLAENVFPVVSSGYTTDATEELVELLGRAWEEGGHTPYSVYEATMRERYDLTREGDDE